MKTVKGEILSTTAISISKAASILSKFVSADPGASQAVCAYLRRTAVSFNESNRLHKELKSHRKRKTLENRIKIEEEGGGDVGMDNGRKRHKKKRETSEYQVGDLKENGSKILINEEDMKNNKKKKKKRKSDVIEEERETYSEESLHKKKKKRKNEEES